MANFDIFKGDAFSLTSLSGTVDKVDYRPGLLGQMGIFTKVPVRNRNIWIDRREGRLELVKASATGAPPEELRKDMRNAVPLQAVRLAKGSTVYAAEIAGWRAFGSESEQTVVMTEYDRRRQRVRADMEATLELHRLGAIQGKLVDSDGELIYDYFAAFGETADPVEDWTLATAATDPRLLAMAMKRKLLRKLKMGNVSGIRIGALAGDAFFDALISNKLVKDTYLNWTAAADLRTDKAFADFSYGGIDFINYRGDDSNEQIAIKSDEAVFFIYGVPGQFEHVMAPADEFIPYVGAPGQEFYGMNILDRDREAWTRYEEYAFPLMVNKRPDLVERAKLA